MRKFWQQVNNAVVGGLSVLVFFVLGFLFWIFDANTLVPMWIIAIVIICCYLICIIVYGICSMKKETTVYRLPTVKSIQRISETFVLIVEKNDLFSQGSYATISYQEDDESLETLIGVGYIESINSLGFMQVRIESVKDTEQAKNILNNIENTSVCRKSIKVKPSIHKELFEEVQSNG